MTASSLEVTPGSGLKLQTNSFTEGGVTVHQQGQIVGEPYLAGYLCNFAAGGSTISTATINSHLIQIMAGPSLRVRIRRIEMHQIVAATAASIPSLALLRLTTAGTGGTAQTVGALDPSDAASGATYMTLPSSKGTESTALWFGGAYFMQTIGASTPLVNPILVVDFDRMRSKPPIIAAGTANGIALKLLNAVAGATVWINVWIDETTY